MTRAAARPSPPPPARRRRVRYEYPAHFRQAIECSLRSESARHVARTYEIPLSTLYRWRRAPLQQGGGDAPQRARKDEGPVSTAARQPARRAAGYIFCVARMRASRQVLARVTQARDMIEQRYFEQIDCAALAAVAGMSKCHFVRTYAQVFGQSPHQHLLRRRVDAALDLLRVTLQPTLAIASAVGFDSCSSLLRAIRKFAAAGAPQVIHRPARDPAPARPGVAVPVPPT